MHYHADKSQVNKSQSVANKISQNQNSGESVFRFVDNRPETIAQRKLQEFANNSPQAKQVAQLQSMADNSSSQQEPLQKNKNKTGLPDRLKSGIENLSGYSMDDVKVHYNSHRPAQLQALAYTQGTDIHVAPRQEHHLPHEAWHVIQQKQGRVKPTMQMKEEALISDDARLEKEADVMGRIAQRVGLAKGNFDQIRSNAKQSFGFVDNRPEALTQKKLQMMSNNSSEAIQRRVDVYLETGSTKKKKTITAQGKVKEFKNGTKAGTKGWVGVTKYRAWYQIDSEDGKFQNKNSVGPLQNDFTNPEAGHVLAKQNGGKGTDSENIFAQDGGTNNSTYKSFETDMRNTLNSYDNDDNVRFVCYLEGENIKEGIISDAGLSDASSISSEDIDWE